MANEFFAEGGSDVAIAITPGDAGILQVIMDGEKIFDKEEEGGHPTLDRVKQLRAEVRERLAAGVAADD